MLAWSVAMTRVIGKPASRSLASRASWNCGFNRAHAHEFVTGRNQRRPCAERLGAGLGVGVMIVEQDAVGIESDDWFHRRLMLTSILGSSKHRWT